MKIYCCHCGAGEREVKLWVQFSTGGYVICCWIADFEGEDK